MTKLFAAPDREPMYATLLMSTGLTLGTISSLFGLPHGIIGVHSIGSEPRLLSRAARLVF